MSSITVRRLPEGVERRLRARAAANARPVGAEVRAILVDALPEDEVAEVRAAPAAERRADLDWVGGLEPLASGSVTD